jgi:hypothetical protein
MGISLRSAIDIQNRFKSLVSDIAADAMRNHLTHEDIAEKLDRLVYSSLSWRKAPGHVRSWLRGYMAGQQEYLASHLVWVMSCDGDLLTANQVRDRAEHERVSHIDKVPGYVSPWMRVARDKCRFVWTRGGAPLLDKPYERKFVEPECEDRQCYCEAKER